MLEVGRGELEAAEAHLKAIEDRALSDLPEAARMYLSTMAELRIWQGRLDEARAAVSDGLDRVTGTDEPRSGRLICLGMRAEADRAERGRAHRDQDAVVEAICAADALVSRVATMAPNPLVSVAAAVPSTTAVRAQWEAERTRLVSMGAAGSVPRIAWVIHAGVDGATQGGSRPVPSIAAARGLAYLGLDVRRDTISVAVLGPGHEAPTVDRIANDEPSIRRLVAQFSNPGRLRACYEAGPTGYELAGCWTAWRCAVR